MANSATVGILRVLLSANTAEFDAAMKKASQSADAWSKDLKSIGAQATAVGSTLTKALTLPLVGLVGASVKAAISFESSFAGIRKTVDGVVDSAGNLTAAGAQMQQAIRALAKEIPVSVEELNKLGESAGALGIPRDKVVDFTKVMAELGVTTNLTSDQAADAIARIQNIFGAAGQDTDRLASTLVALGNAGASTEKEIVEMSQRIAGAGHTVGLTQAQVLGFASAMASVGINAEAGGSAISRVFLKINDAVSKGGKSLDEFARVAGMSGAEFKKAFEADAAGATTKFIEGIQRLKGAGENVNSTIEGLTGKNIILKDTILRLAGAGTLLRDQLTIGNKAWQDNTALTKEAEQRFKTTESQLALLWNRIKDVGITLGNALLPGINAAITAMDVLLPIVDTLAKAFAALPGGIQGAILGFVGLAAAVGPVTWAFGQVASGASTIIGIFGKKGIATRALAVDQETLAASSTKVTGAMGLLGTAASLAGAAFVGWQIGRLIADLTGLDQKIADSLTGLDNLRKARQLASGGDKAGADAEVASRLVDLEKQRTQAIQAHNLAGAALLSTQIETLKNDQTRLAIQDTINRAIKGGADAHITYAAAVKFNQDALTKQQAAQVAAAAATHQGVTANTAAGASVSMLAQLNATYAADLQRIGKSGFKEIQEAHEKFGVSLKDLAGKYGVAETSIDRWIDGTKEAAKATKAAAKELSDAEKYVKRFTDAADELDKELRAAAAAGMPMSVVLEEFGSQITDVTHKAPLFGKAVGDATAAAAAALKESDIQKAGAKLIEQLNDQARSMVGQWKKAGEDSARAAAEALAKGNAAFLKNASDLQKGLIGLDKDSLDKRQSLIRLEFDDKRAALDKFGTFYKQQLDLLNAQEARALKESTETWKREQRNKATASLDALSQAFSQLSQIAGGSFGGVSKWIGETLSQMALARKAVDSLKDSFASIGEAFSGEGIDFSALTQALATAISSGIAAGAALWQATDPSHKSTTQTVVGGALVGGQIGDSTGLPGAGLVGMGVGALVGWWRSSHAEWKKVSKDIGRDIGVDISDGLAQQIADMEKTLRGGTKDQRRKWAEALSLDAIIQEAGGLKSSNIDAFTRQASNLFEVVRRGGEEGAKATEVLNGLIGQFGDYAETTGGMWDPTFKKLLADSKALGVNLDAVNAAIDKQTAKLSGGLASAIKGAFSGSDKAFGDLTKDLKPEQVGALTDPSKRKDSGLGDDVLARFTRIQVESQAGFDRLSRTALASFNAIVASGSSAFDAITQIGPAVDQLIAEHDKLGLAGGAAYDQLARFRNLTSVNADLVASVGGLNDTMVALSNLGGLNADVLADLEAQGLDTFSKLQVAGFTQNEALQQMVPFLESVIKAHKDLNEPIDENTQALIDQAEANGLLSDDTMSMLDVLKEGFAALIKAVGGEVPAAFDKMAKAAKDSASDAKDALDGIPKQITIGVQTTGVTRAFDDFERDGVDASRNVQDEVDAVSFGHSPGGIKEIPIQLGIASGAFDKFNREVVTPLVEVKGAVDGAAAKAGDLNSALGSMRVPPSFTGEITSAMSDIGGLAGTTKDVVDEALGSVDSLGTGVAILSTTAKTAAADVATVGNVIYGAFGAAITSADTLRQRIGDVTTGVGVLGGALVVVPWEVWGGRGVDQSARAQGGVDLVTVGVEGLSTALDNSPWTAWASLAVSAVDAVIGKVDALATRLTDVALQILSLPAPSSTTPPGTGPTPTVPGKGGPVIIYDPGKPNGGTIPFPSRTPLPPIQTLGSDAVRALGANFSSAASTQGAGANATAQPATVTNHISVDVSGRNVGTPEDRRALAIEIAREIEKGGTVRTAWADQVTALARQA